MPAEVSTARTGTEPEVHLVTVTPDQARGWLQKNHERNRKLRPHKVAEYAADMKAGRWVLSDQAVTFDSAGVLLNGQHRLTAVVRSGCEVRFLVLWNAPSRTMLVTDGGMRRSTNDHFSMAGCGHPAGCGATVRRVFMGLANYAGQSISDLKVDEFMGEYGAAVAFVHQATGKFKMTHASVRAVLVRAKIRRVAGEKLERFAEVLGTGIMSPGENAVVLLRNHILKMKTKANVADSGTARQNLYAITETALKAFLDGERPTTLKPTKEELFSIPTDKGAAG